MSIDRKLGILLLSLYLIAVGASEIVGLHFNGQNYVMGGLAVASGVLLLIRR